MPRIELNERLRRFQKEAYARGFAPNSSPKEANLTKAFFELYARPVPGTDPGPAPVRSARHAPPHGRREPGTFSIGARNGARLPLAERQARSFAYALTREPVLIHPHTRIAGQIFQRCPGAGCPELYGGDPRWQEYSVAGNARRLVAERLPENAAYAKFFCDGAAPGHVGWDWGMMLNEGAQGMLDRHAEAHRLAADPKSREFHLCAQIVLSALVEWAALHARVLRDMAQKETDPLRRAELLDMAGVCERVPRFPARTFREAVQSFFFQHLAVMFENPFGGNGPGRMDYYLWPFLEKDLREGSARQTDGRAAELLVELLIKLHERIAAGDGWVEAVVVGGRNPDGTSAVNPLSHLIVEAAIALRQTHPSVYVRLHDHAPADFVDLAVRYLLEGENRAQIYGDDNVIRALAADGIPLEDARHWCAGGCMEVGMQGMSGDLLFAFAHNAPRTLELLLNGGRLLLTGDKAIGHEKTLADYGSFDELLHDFETELARELGILLRRLDIYLECYARYRPSFLLSTMVHDTFERGRSINEGGARYPHYGGSVVGIPNVGDSLYAVKRALFEDKFATGAELLAALRADFKGFEGLRRRLLNIPKYGAENAEADAMTDRVLRLCNRTLKSHRNPLGGHCRPIILGFTWVVSYGAQVGATPDGRLAGRPLAQSLSPQSGAAMKGLTGAINSATSLSLDEVSGGASMMWDLDKAWAAPDVVRSVLLTFIQKGGHIFQGNVMDVGVLLEAQKDPDRYRDLMVRVGGFSARFVALGKETQEEIISRHRFGGRP